MSALIPVALTAAQLGAYYRIILSARYPHRRRPRRVIAAHWRREPRKAA
jgi:hypothetical protein